MIALDTDVLIDVLRGFAPAAAWLRALDNERLYVPGYAAMELVQGCADKRELQRTQRVIGGLAIVWPTASDCNRALSDFARLRLPHGVGMIDCLVAHTAIGYGLQLATFNARHYAHIPHVVLIEPYSR